MPKTTTRRRDYRARAPAARSVPFLPSKNYRPMVLLEATTRQQKNIEETQKLWQMRWFFAIVIAIWIPTAMTVTIVVFCLTKNSYSLSLFSTLAPPVYFLHRFAKYLLPKDKRDYQLAALKIQQLAKRNKGFL